MQIDPAAVVRCWAVDVDLGPHTVTIPALPARPWLTALITEGWAGIVPGLLPADSPVDDLITDGTITSAECTAAARAALAAAAGCPWWTAQRLAHGCVAGELGAELVLRGVDPDRLPLAAYLAAGYRAASRHLDDPKRARLDSQLEAPPRGIPVEEWWDRAAAANSFMQAIAGG
jgi:hypothetical protein